MTLEYKLCLNISTLFVRVFFNVLSPDPCLQPRRCPSWSSWAFGAV